MNYTALITKFIDLLETQAPEIPAAAWEALPDLETRLATATTDEASTIAEELKNWAKPYPHLFTTLREQQLVNPRANLPDEDEEDNNTAADDAGLITNETLRRTIRTALENRPNPD